MELTLWWVEEKNWSDDWQPEYGPYVDKYTAEEKAREIDGTSGWGYREPTARVRGMIVKGEEAW